MTAVLKNQTTIAITHEEIGWAKQEPHQAALRPH